MNIVNVLKKPIITEKTYKLMEMNKYVFVVDSLANKEEVKIAFIKIFGVEVQCVNILKRKPKKKRVGRFLGKTSGIKKAIITIKPGQKLNILQDDQSNDKTSKTEKKSVFEKFKQRFTKTKIKKTLNKQVNPTPTKQIKTDNVINDDHLDKVDKKN